MEPEKSHEEDGALRSTTQVEFEPIGRRVACEPGATLLEAAQQAGVMLAALCGGEGSCGRCIVRVMKGQVTDPSPNEIATLRTDANVGVRLACQTRILGDVRVHVPPDSLVGAQRIQTEGELPDVELNPAVRAVEARIDEPCISDLRSDARRLRDALGYPDGSHDVPDLDIDTTVMRRLSGDLRSWNWEACAFLREVECGEMAPGLSGKRPIGRLEIIALRPLGSSPLGLAVDIGTTKLAAYLVDLRKGATIGHTGAINPQVAYGEDVMARIRYALSQQDGAKQLGRLVVEATNNLASELCAQAGRAVADIADAVIVGNTAMHHLFLGLPVKQLGFAPYVPAESAGIDIKGREIGLDLAQGSYVHMLPNVAGFVGADHVGMLLATGVAERDGVVLGIDIGTNTEISLKVPGRHLACSAASGPAFEGAHIGHGMRAAPGAIERVVIRDGHVYISTVDDVPPVGICGSGALDLVAQLLKADLLEARGALKTHPRVRQGDSGTNEFLVVPGNENNGREITFSRLDVVEILLAKAAVRAGIRVLLDKAGVDETEIDEIIIAGAFGTYIDVQSGIDIGMFPSVDLHCFRQVGNAAGAGARMALLSVDQRERAANIASHIEYVELAAEKGFKAEFTRALRLGH
jgi:uncharacterized 2Fe-2S/4Fe-4S cluster protein (DUF4445 family)